MNREIEIKLQLDINTFNQLVVDQSDFQFERTYGFFIKTYDNIQAGIFPRIKETVKGDVRNAYMSVKLKNDNNDNTFFVRDEYEFVVTEINDNKINEMRGVFHALGYIQEHIFEKKRFQLTSVYDCDLVVDMLPFGYFLEIEGDELNIDKTITYLHLEGSKRITSAYLALWEEYKKEHNIEGECVF